MDERAFEMQTGWADLVATAGKGVFPRENTNVWSHRENSKPASTTWLCLRGEGGKGDKARDNAKVEHDTKQHPPRASGQEKGIIPQQQKIFLITGEKHREAPVWTGSKAHAFNPST